MTNYKLFIAGMVGLLFMAVAVGFLPVPTQAASYCAPYASKQCISNIVYWYDSCGALQDVAQNCNITNQICQNAQCVDKPPVYVKHATKQCYNNNVHWYDSKGVVQEVQKSCTDSNSCTLDSCAGATCSNTLKCDGSTCATGSADYITYCGGNQGGQTQTNFIASLSVKKEADTQWQEAITASPGNQLQFSLVIANNNAQPAHGSSIKVDIANAIEYTGNLQINGVLSAGSILNGIDLGTIGAGESKNISFTGNIILPVNSSAQITATATSASASTTDKVTVTSAEASDQDTTDGSAADSAIVDFFKRWYLWIIIVGILVVLFLIIFRRLGRDG